MFAYYIILVYASQFIQIFDKFALILPLPIAIGIVYRFYVNLHDSKYLHVRFVVCACWLYNAFILHA
jgi:4-hydroxybenzoate polyprenyltransferase